MSAVRICAYCACGGSIDAYTRPAQPASDVVAAWRELHSRPECEPCDQRTANNARRRQRRAERRYAA